MDKHTVKIKPMKMIRYLNEVQQNIGERIRVLSTLEQDKNGVFIEDFSSKVYLNLSEHGTVEHFINKQCFIIGDILGNSQIMLQVLEEADYLEKSIYEQSLIVFQNTFQNIIHKHT
eukprot:maker-scaffold_46-snap-gene-1.92-mRNA-1 protein AED:0.00 eAED:0.00 QI:49/1/1/1/1/1/2/50/115